MSARRGRRSVIAVDPASRAGGVQGRAAPRARSRSTNWSAATGSHGADLAVRPQDADLGARSPRPRPDVDPAELAAARGRRRPSARGASSSPPTRTSSQPPIASRFGLPDRRTRTCEPVAHRRRAPRAVPRADVPPDPDRRAVVDLDEVEQAVEVEVGERRAAAPVEARGSRPRRRALDERAVGLAEEEVARDPCMA